MKIALFHNLPHGGGKRALYNLTSLLKKDHEIDLYIPSVKDPFLDLSHFGVNVYKFKLPPISNFFDYLLFIYKKLPLIHRVIAEKINKKKYSAVFVNPDYLTKAPYLLRFIKHPSIYLCPEPPREFYESLSLYSFRLKYILINLLRYPLKYIDYFNASFADLLLTNSKYSSSVLSKIYNKNALVLKHGVNADKFKFLDIERSKFFLTVGALSRFKGIDFLIRVISKLPDKYRYPLYIVADGGRDKDYMISLASRFNVKIVLKNNLTDNELLLLYNGAFLYLHAAIKEPLGLSLLEAQACGLPVLAINEGGVKEVVVQGLSLLTKRQVDKFVKKLVSILTKGIKHDERLKLSNYIRREYKWSDSYKLLNEQLELLNKYNTL